MALHRPGGVDVRGAEGPPFLGTGKDRYVAEADRISAESGPYQVKMYP
jgi:hypothetical protein